MHDINNKEHHDLLWATVFFLPKVQHNADRYISVQMQVNLP